MKNPLSALNTMEMEMSIAPDCCKAVFASLLTRVTLLYIVVLMWANS